MKKILLLGGSTQQIPAILYAKKKGYYTILCDYLKENPGQHHAHKFYCISTTDKKAILEVAQKEKVHGVVAYASDPAAPTAAYVGNKLNLPSNPYKSVKILAYKDLFRNFLKEKGFFSPQSKKFISLNNAKKEINNFSLPLIIKPTDSSGSKGVSKIENFLELDFAFNNALQVSRKKEVIIEEYIDKDHAYMVGGDCFVINGKIAFLGLLDCYRSKIVSPFVPIGNSFPTSISSSRYNIITKNLQQLFDLLKIKFGAFNIEIIFDKNNNLYFIEVGPRNGGNMIPDLLLKATHNDMIAATIETALGNPFTFKKTNKNTGFFSTFVLYSSKKGILKKIHYQNNIKKNIFKEVLYKKPKEQVEIFNGANKALGIIFLKFNTQKEQLLFMENPENWIRIEVI